MIRIIFIFILLSIFKDNVIAQTDSLINFKDLVFNTDLEKTSFEALNGNDKFRFFNLSVLSGTGKTDKPLLEYQSYFKKLKSELPSGQKPEKLVKGIYKNVHNDLLKKYELKSDFADIFSNGMYNCVSASLLYSCILEDYDLSYQIKETENHVYIVALPEAKGILLESTNPAAGYKSSLEMLK